MELYVYDFNINRLGIIDVYSESEFEQHYEKHNQTIITVEGNEENARLLLSEELRIIVRSDDIYRGYIIDTAEYEDESKLNISIIGQSLGSMIGWRTAEGQQRFVGNIEDALKYFVNLNCINPVDTKRIIPNLVLGVNQGIDIDVDITLNGQNLDIVFWETCNANGISYEILIDHDNKKFVFSTFMGEDRSTEQSVNSHVIFAKEFDNVVRQNYIDDKSNMKTTAYVLGEGEGNARKRVTIGSDLYGVNRREITIDARDLQQTYLDENDNEITMTDEQYTTALSERGNSKLSDYQRIRTFESEIDLHTQFRYKEHYFLGDKVTNRNDELGVVIHSRVVSVYETFTRKGYELKLEFGTSIPTLIDKIKREVKR